MMLYGVCQAAAPPLVYLDGLAVIVSDDLLNALQYSACLLFADFGVEDEAKFIITPHEATSFLWVCFRSIPRHVARRLPEQVEHGIIADALNVCRTNRSGLLPLHVLALLCGDALQHTRHLCGDGW